MQGNTEYEVGEARCYKDVGGNIDFDFGFDFDFGVHIGERVQVALGHLIKDFEGDYSPECSGPKYGQYGSFMPTCERSPPLQSHPRTSQRHSNSPSSNPRSEAAFHHSKAPLNMPPSMRLGTASHNAPPFHNSRAPLVDDSVKKDTGISSNAEIEKCTSKDDCATKPENFTDQRALKLRIKVKPDILSKKNAAIYSGLGLDDSPSSSMGNSPKESEVMPPVSQENPEESPTSIVRVMSSFTIPSGVLISPLHDNLLYLKKEEVLRDSRPMSSCSGHQEHCSMSTDESDSFAGDRDLLKKRRVGMVGQSEKQYINGNCSKSDMALHQKKIFGNRTPDGKDFLSTDLKSTPLSSSICDAGETAEVIGKGFKISKKVNKDGVEGRRVSIEAVKEDSLESISGQDFVKVRKQNTGNSNLKKVSEHKPEIRQNNNASDLMNNGKYNALMISEKAECDQKGRIKSEGKNKSKGEWSPGKAMIATEKDSIGATNNSVITDKKSAGIGVTGNNKLLKIKSSKDKTRDSLKEKRSERKVGRIDQAPVNKAKITANHDSIEGKSTYRVKVKEKSSDDKVANQLLAGSCVKDAPGAFPIAENKPVPEMVSAPPPAAPQFIEENWVCCDRCQTWRLLPMGLKPDQLPKEWLCSMLYWLPGMNRCHFSEDETTRALYALYQIPISEVQNNMQTNPTGPETGVSSSDALQFDRNHKISSSDGMSARGKKKQGIKKNTTSGISSDMHQLSNAAKNNAQGSGKNNSLIDVNQQPAGSNLLKKSSSKHLSGLKILMEEKNIPKEKEEQMSGGDINPVKLKRKMVADQYRSGTLKKSRTEGVHSADKQLNLDMDFEKVGLNSSSCLPAKASGKNMMEHGEYCFTKDVQNKSVVSLKKGDQAQLLSDDESLDVTNSGKNGSTKKRKSNDWLDNKKHNNILSVQGDMGFGEESNVSGFRKEKKHRVLNPEEKSVAEGDDKLNRKGVMKQTFSLDSRDQMALGTQLKSVDKAKQPRKLRKNVASYQDLGCFDPSGKDLESGQLPLAATSSSSKISGSRKARNNLVGMRGSPVESVTSSPLRTSNLDRRILAAGNTSEKVDSKKGTPSSMSSGRSSDGMVGKLSVKLKGRSLHDIPTQHGNCGNGSHQEEKMNKNDQDNASWQKPEKVTSLQVKEKNRRSGSEVRRDKMNISASENGFSKKGVNYESALTPSYCASGTETRTNAKISSSDSRNKNVDHLSKKSSSRNWSNEAGNQTEPKQKGFENSVLKVGAQCSTNEKIISQQNLIHNFEEENKAIPVHTGSRDGKAKILSSSENKAKQETSYMDSRTAPESQKGDMSSGHPVHAINSADVSCKVGVNRSSGNLTLDAQFSESSPITTNSRQTASGILEEARKLKDSADHYKNSGFEFESNETYFKAALKFLHGASLVENCHSESSKLGEMDQIQIYATAPKLFESCAHKYERCQEMVSAALAYKCMEVAYMRLVYCKHSRINKDQHELQSALQMVSQGESPSSSASDIDNLNNMVAVDKATFPRGTNTHVANNQVISAQNRSNITRLLDFTQDINFAMEASRKCRSIFMAAKIMEEARNSDCMTSIRNVIDFSFQDVEEFVHLVLIATKAITRAGLSGARD